MYCNVLVIKPFNQYFTYKIEDHQKIKVGHIVQVPFGNKSDLNNAEPIHAKSVKFFSLHSTFAPKSKTTFILF